MISLYAPNTDTPNFFNELRSLLQNYKADYDIICGDFNLVLNPLVDTFNYKHINNPKSRQAVLKICEDLDLLDIYRYFYPTTHRYTWRKKNPLKQARLDFFLVSRAMTDLVYNCDIKAGYRSDHSILFLDITVNKFSMG